MRRLGPSCSDRLNLVLVLEGKLDLGAVLDDRTVLYLHVKLNYFSDPEVAKRGTRASHSRGSGSFPRLGARSYQFDDFVNAFGHLSPSAFNALHPLIQSIVLDVNAIGTTNHVRFASVRATSRKKPQEVRFMLGRAVSSTKGPVNLVARGGKRSSEEYEPLFVSALQLDDVFG